MLLPDPLIDATDASLQKALEALNAVGMGVCLNVGPGFMVEAAH
jgi:hypothetical protein